jgi:hypothetical protein
MFGLLKWIIIFGLIGSVWFIYDIASDLSLSDKRALKKDAIEALDNGNTEPLTSSIGEKLRHEYREKKSGVMYQIRQKLRNLVDSWTVDGDQN